MWWNKWVFVSVCLLQTRTVLSQWSCTQDTDCNVDLPGAVCNNGVCGCSAGQQTALGGTACVDLAPYHTSTCVEDHQCSRLFTSFECRKENGTQEGSCLCQEGYHYFLGRCWRSVDFGAACSRDEECLGVPRNPFSLQCNGTCVCADGFYERQRAECRQIGYTVGDGCVVNEDCQFPNGVCDINTRSCYDRTAPPTPASETETRISTNATSPAVSSTVSAGASARSHGLSCGFDSPCAEPFECSTFGACVCPIGYYVNDAGTGCNAELGSPSTPEQCVGLLAIVIDGICTCPANFFFEENMRDCIKVTRQITDSCVTDANCHTFGTASFCGEPTGPWGLRTCGCLEDQSVWASDRQMCRLFAGIGGTCEVDNDCLDIPCIEGICTCPEGTVPYGELCLTSGKSLNDTCQATPECTGTPYAVCDVNGRCSCGDGYQEMEDSCAPIVGGTCYQDEDCVIQDTVCVNSTATDTATCQCRDGFVGYDDICWPVALGYRATCNVTAQCTDTLGADSLCADGECECVSAHHYRDSGCWTITTLFEACSRSSQCFLSTGSEKTVCRNSMCQCDFNFPYDEELGTCISSAATTFASATVIVTVLTYLILS